MPLRLLEKGWSALDFKEKLPEYYQGLVNLFGSHFELYPAYGNFCWEDIEAGDCFIYLPTKQYIHYFELLTVFIINKVERDLYLSPYWECWKDISFLNGKMCLVHNKPVSFYAAFSDTFYGSFFYVGNINKKTEVCI